MDGIKLSALEEKKIRINGSRKSKGKFSFVQKIKYFYLGLKYRYLGIEKFTDKQLDEFIQLLNEKELTYKKAVEDFEKEKEDVDRDLKDTYERISSLDSQKYEDLAGDQKLFEAASNAIEDKKAIDAQIADQNGSLRAINVMKENAEAELEAREVEREVAGKEIQDEINAIKKQSEERQVEEQAVQEEVTKEENMEQEEAKNDTLTEEEASLVKPEDDEETQDLYNKIIEQTEKLNTPVDQEIAKPFEVNYPTAGNLEVPQKEPISVSKEDKYAELLNQFNASMNEETKRMNNEIISSFNNYVENMRNMITNFVTKIQEEDRRIAQEIIDTKDAEIRSEQDKNAELSKTNDDLNNSLNDANDTITRRDKTIEELNTTIDQKDNEISDEKDKTAKLTQANNNLEREKEDLIKENESKDAKIRELEAALAERNKDVADREEEIAKRDKEITSLNNKVDEVQKAKQAAEEAAAKRAEAIKAVLFAGAEPKTEEAKTM